MLLSTPLLSPWCRASGCGTTRRFRSDEAPTRSTQARRWAVCGRPTRTSGASPAPTGPDTRCLTRSFAWPWQILRVFHGRVGATEAWSAAIICRVHPCLTYERSQAARTSTCRWNISRAMTRLPVACSRLMSWRHINDSRSHAARMRCPGHESMVHQRWPAHTVYRRHVSRLGQQP